MAETNFYSYMFAQAAEAVAFDELAEIADLSSPESIQRAFISYLSDYTPPVDIKDALLEEKFKKSNAEDSPSAIVYEASIPGVEGMGRKEELQAYFEDFLDRIGAERNSESGYEVDVSLSNDERGGEDLDIYIALSGKQIRTGKKEE